MAVNFYFLFRYPLRIAEIFHLEQEIITCKQTIARQEVKHHTHNYNQRDKVGHIGDGLDGALKAFAGNFIQQKGEDNRRWEA